MSDYNFTPKQHKLIDALLNIIGDNGHTIFDESILDPFPAGIRKRFVAYHESDGTLKGTITDASTGKRRKGIKGVYGLEVLQAIANDLGLKYHYAIGRGLCARNATQAIKNWLGKQKLSPSEKLDLALWSLEEIVRLTREIPEHDYEQIELLNEIRDYSHFQLNRIKKKKVSV